MYVSIHGTSIGSFKIKQLCWEYQQGQCAENNFLADKKVPRKVGQVVICICIYTVCISWPHNALKNSLFNYLPFFQFFVTLNEHQKFIISEFTQIGRYYHISIIYFQLPCDIDRCLFIYVLLLKAKIFSNYGLSVRHWQLALFVNL